MKAKHLIPGRRGLLVASGILALLIAIYALAGFVLAPWLVKREIPRRAAEAGAQARIDEITFNPFTLSLRLRGLSIEEPDGTPLLGTAAAQADIEWRPLLRGDVALSAVTLHEPAVHMRISEKGELNLAALGRPRPGGEEKPGRVPGIALENLAIENGRLTFEDRRQGYRNSFENLSLKLASVSTAPNDTGRYELVARTADGGKLNWHGEASLAPVSLSGTLVLEHGALPQINPYLQSLSGLRITSGRARVSLSHRFSLLDGKALLQIQDASVALDQVALAMRGSEQPFATIGRLGLEGLSADLQARRAAAQTLTIGNFSLKTGRDAQGAFQPQGFATASKSEKEAAWTFALAEMRLADGTLSFADAANGLSWTLERIAARAQSLSSDMSRPIAFELEAEIADGGRLAARGKAIPAENAVQARIEASGVPLAPIEGFIARHAGVKLLSGSLAMAGDLAVGDQARTGRGRNAKLSYSGAASLENVAIQDAAGAPLVQWKTLATKALRLTIAPNAARMDELRWIAPKGRLEISPDGTTNLGRAFGRKKGQAPGSPAPAESKREAPRQAGATEGGPPDEVGDFPIRIRRVRVEHGGLDFADRSLNPHFSTLIHALSGTVNGISTDRNTRSQIALDGRVDEYGHARLSGSLNFFDPEERTNLRVQMRNLEVARLSPYTIKFAGYRVASGRMTLDLNYRVNESRLQGDNKILLDDFTLGERVGDSDSPVPLELAVSLLKDADGRIDLAVPISGSLDDPNFSLSEVIWKAIGNIVRNVVAAPFRALGRLFGAGSEALAAIAFEPGGTRLLPPEQEKLKRIADGLARRADLKVVIPARYDAEADARALKRAALRQEIARRAGFGPGEGDAASPINIEDRRTRNAMRALFAERFGDDALDQMKNEAEREAARDGKAPDLSVLERFRKFAGGEPRVADARGFYRSLFRRLLEAQSLPDSALGELAQKRAAAIADGLRAAGVEPARVELANAEPTANADAREVTVSLSLAPLR